MKHHPHVQIQPRGDALDVTLVVPTYSGEAKFTLCVEPDADGDWRVFLPDVSEYEVEGEVVYLGSPDAEECPGGCGGLLPDGCGCEAP